MPNQITKATGKPFKPLNHQSIGGGCINNACVLEGGSARYFVKLNNATGLDMFEAEAEGLDENSRGRTSCACRYRCAGDDGDRAYLVWNSLPWHGVQCARSKRSGGNWRGCTA